MITKDEIRTTLSDIRFYYANIKSFQNASKYVGENKIVKTAEKFNIAIGNAPPKLYELVYSPIHEQRDDGVRCRRTELFDRLYQ